MLPSEKKKTRNSSIERVKFVQERKLCKLGYVCDDDIPRTKYSLIFQIVLSDLEKTALSKGLNFVFLSQKIVLLITFYNFKFFLSSEIF